MTRQTNESCTIDRRAFTIPEACKICGIGRSSLYSEMKSGRLKASKVGRRTIIRSSDLDAWLESLQR